MSQNCRRRNFLASQPFKPAAGGPKPWLITMAAHGRHTRSLVTGSASPAELPWAASGRHVMQHSHLFRRKGVNPTR